MIYFLVLGVVILLGISWLASFTEEWGADEGLETDAEKRERIRNKRIPVLLRPDSIRGTISLMLASASLFVILSGRYGTADQSWAYATIGALTGFWLRAA